MSAWFQVVVGLVSVSLFVFCDYTITRWAELIKTDGYWTWRFFLMLVVAPLSTICFGLVGAKMGLATVSGFINTGIVIGGVLVGVLVKSEHLTLHQKLGLLLGFVAMLLVNLGGAPESQLPTLNTKGGQ